jgi:hypothetical protein
MISRFKGGAMKRILRYYSIIHDRGVTTVKATTPESAAAAYVARLKAEHKCVYRCVRDGITYFRLEVKMPTNEWKRLSRFEIPEL